MNWAIFFPVVALLITANHFFQTDPDYNKLWKEVERLDRKGLYTSAKKKVEEIREWAVREAEQKQLLKADLYLAKYTGLLSENDIEQSIVALEKSIDKTEDLVLRSIAHSYLIELYENLYQRDLSSLDQQERKEKMFEHARASLEHLASCFVPIEPYGIFLDVTENSKNSQEYLSSILYERASKKLHAEFNKQLLNYPNSLALTPQEFLSTKFSNDSLGLFQIMQNYEELLLENKATLLLADHYFDRFSLVGADSTSKEKLKSFAENADNEQVFVRAFCRFGDLFDQYDLCKKFYKNSELPPYERQLVLQTLEQIETPHVRIEMEEVFHSQAPVVLTVKQKMVGQVKLDIRKMDPVNFRKMIVSRNVDQKALFEEGEELFSKVLAPNGASFYYALPDLGLGQYAIRLQATAEDSLVLNPSMHTKLFTFQVSDLSVIEQENKDLFILNRQSGSALEDVKVNVYEYSGRGSQDVHSVYSGATDTNGIFYYPLENNYKSKGLWLQDGEDQLIVPHVSFYKYRKSKNQHSKAQLLTDRSLYKPGETIKFSGIITRLRSDIGIHYLSLKNSTVEVELVNAQRQVISSLTLMPDDFGAFHGSFALPEQVLPGVFHIKVNNLYSCQVQVEEYKAPKFEVILSQANISEDSLLVKGLAVALAGYPVADAEVDYSVRLERIRRWYYYDRSNSSNNQGRLIQSGKLTTDSDGKFQIQWQKAKLDRSYFMQYCVETKIRDQNGELVEASVHIPLNTKGLSVNWGSLKRESDISELSSTKITFKNIEGEQVFPDNAQWNLYKYERSGTKSNKVCPYFGNLQEKLVQGEPEDVKRALEYYSVKKEQLEPELIADGSLREDGILPLIRHVKQAGNYKIKLKANDQEFQFNMAIQSVRKAQSPSSKPLVHHFNREKASPGESIRLSLNASETKELNVRKIISQNGRILEESWLKVGQLLEENILIEEKHRGNINIDLFYVLDGRFHRVSQLIEIPFENKKIHVEFLKWPKNADTDAEEKIVLKVKDHFGRPVKAQFVVSIYDKRLEEIKKHQWDADYYPSYNSQTSLNGHQYRKLHSAIYHIAYPWNHTKYRSTEFKNVFGLRFYTNMQYLYGSRAKRLDTIRRISPTSYEEILEVVPAGAPLEKELMDQSGRRDASSENDGSRDGKPKVQLRSDLSSLMHFNGQVRTNEQGIAEIEFKTSDAISSWVVLLHGHTTDLSYYVTKEEFKTYKPVLVEPNLPRFVHEGDEMLLSAKVVNRTDKPLSLTPEVSYAVDNSEGQKSLQVNDGGVLNVDANGSSKFKTKVKIPSGAQTITFRFSVRGDDYGDAVEKSLPVRSNTVELISAIPIQTFKGNTTWDQNEMSKIINNPDYEIEQIALEYTGHEYIPILIALTGVFEEEERFAIEIFDKWQAFNMVERLLEIAPELKEILIDMQAQEVPINPVADLEAYRIVDIDQSKWSRQGEKTEKELYNQLDNLLDDSLRRSEMSRLWRKLSYLQSFDGGIKWCASARYSSFSTSLNIAENYMRLYHLGLLNEVDEGFTQRLMSYLSKYFQEIVSDDERNIMSYDRYWLSYATAWKNWNPKESSLWDPSPYIDSIKADFMNYPVGVQARIALFLQDKSDPMEDTIRQSLIERSFYDAGVGRFWNEIGGWRWGEWKLNAQSWLLEYFKTAGQDEAWLMEMKQWLVSHKQGNAWRNARQTADAVLSFYLTAKEKATIPEVRIFNDAEGQLGKGFPYFFGQWQNASQLSGLRIDNSSQYGYGAFLIRYKAATEQVKEGSGELPLTLQVQYNRVMQDGLEPVIPTDMKAGDKILVQLAMESDRPMDFLVIKHNRASGFEPTERLSGFHWQPNPHYSANYADHQALFIEHVARGTHFYEYEFFVEQEGLLHSGISQIQSMYAPEFANNTDNTIFKIKSKQ